MSMAAPSTDRWVVFHHTRAQVPTVEARLPGLEIHLFGLPEGFTREEVEGWIGSLAAASREGAVAASPDDPIPPVLRHVLGGLLFSHAELWGRSAITPFSIVLVHEHGRVAFGWVGNAAVRVHVAGREVVPEWVSVRDHYGRESHAWRGDAREDLRIELFCATGSGGDAAAVQLEVEWVGTAREGATATLDATPRPVPAHEERVTLERTLVLQIDDLELDDFAEGTTMLEIDALEPLDSVDEFDAVAATGEGVGAPPEPPIAEQDTTTGTSGSTLSADEVLALEEQTLEEQTPEEPPSSGVARWLAQALGWRKKPTTDHEGEDHPESAEVVSAQEERVEVAEHPTAVAVDIAVTSTESDAVASATAAAPEPEATREDIHLPPEVPPRIPPTPEAPEVTARAVQSFSTLDDPHAIALPGAPTPESAAPPVVPALSIPAAPAPVAETELRIVDLPPVSAPTGEALERPAAEPSFPAGAPLTSSLAPTDAEPVPYGPVADRFAPAAAPASVRRARRPTWPTLAVPQGGLPGDWRRWAIGGGIVLILFGGGWLLGSSQGGAEHKPSPVMSFLRRIGLAGARFETIITSEPEGAAIAVDGKDTGRLTPATLELTPGEHRVDLSFPDLGAASYLVNGTRGEKVPLEATLWGSVDVTVSDATTPIAVAVDGQARGFAPLQIDSLGPGPHDLRFTGPGMASWGTTVEVRVGEVREVLAYPLQSPATGLLQIRATLTQDGESETLPGARVMVDGVARGFTPLTLELPRGPHSLKVSYQKETAPVQVIDLPGGNQRFATFEFGLEVESPELTLRAPAQITADEPVLISATLGQVAARDVREMWLHIRTPDDRWRRYPMTLIDAQGSAVGAAPFPATAIGSETTRYYVSALTSQGDEFFTEMQSIARRR